MSIVGLLLECVELSYRQGAGDVRLREGVHNAMAISSLCSLHWFCPAFDGPADGSHAMNDEHRYDLTLKKNPQELNYHTHCLGCLMFLLIYLNLVLVNLHHGLEAKAPNLLTLATAEVAGHL